MNSLLVFSLTKKYQGWKLTLYDGMFVCWWLIWSWFALVDWLVGIVTLIYFCFSYFLFKSLTAYPERKSTTEERTGCLLKKFRWFAANDSYDVTHLAIAHFLTVLHFARLWQPYYIYSLCSVMMQCNNAFTCLHNSFCCQRFCSRSIRDCCRKHDAKRISSFNSVFISISFRISFWWEHVVVPERRSLGKPQW